jgi:hypothetical protein
MKIVLVVLLGLCLQASYAQGSPRDGNWLKNGLDAFDRTTVTQTSRDGDGVEAAVLIAYVYGMLAVHRQNNFTAGVLSAALMQPNSTLSDVNRAKLQIANVFVPLLTIPDELSPQQVAAVLRKHLAQNPSHWGRPAERLITDAFASEFGAKK